MDRLDQLIESAVAGTATAEEWREFGVLLKQPNSRRRVAEAMRLCGGIAMLRPAPRRRWTGWPVMLAAAACLAITVGFLFQAVIADDIPPSAGRIVAAEASASVQGASTRPAAVGMSIAPDEVVIGSCTVELPDGSRCLLSEDGQLRLASPSTPLALDRGRVEVRAVPQQPGNRLAIRTHRLEASVVGTRFTVDVGADDDVVAIQEGTVQVATGENLKDFTAGAVLRSDGLTLRSAVLPPAEVSIDLAAPTVPVSGTPLDQGLAPAFDHLAGKVRMHLLRVGSTTAPLAALHQDSQLSLVHDLPAETKAVLVIGVVRLPDRNGWIGNLRQEMNLAAGRSVRTEVKLGTMKLANGEALRGLRGDEAIAFVMLLTPDTDAGLRLSSVGVSSSSR